VTVVTGTDPSAQKAGGRFIDESLTKYLEFVDKYIIGAARELQRDAIGFAYGLQWPSRENKEMRVSWCWS
jgi:hypothetical protein